MSAVETRTIAEDEAGLRLDRWFSRHFPHLTHGRLEKLLRTGQVRVDGARAKANVRLEAGQLVRVPPLPDAPPDAVKPGPHRISDSEARDLQAAVLYRDDDVIVLNKPPGLATQGGTGQTKHVDGMLDVLRFDAKDRPRLVHRLDKDTSGVLLLGRNARATAWLAEAFRDRHARKLYWALTVGVPQLAQGKIDMPLAKQVGPGGERMMGDDDAGKPAVTLYQVLETAGRKAAWLALAPLTGRTHQLRTHCAAMGTPIVGDGKYGGDDAYLRGAISPLLHLHARSISIPRPRGGVLNVKAPLPPHMRETWKLFGLDEEDDRDPFPDQG